MPLVDVVPYTAPSTAEPRLILDEKNVRAWTLDNVERPVREGYVRLGRVVGAIRARCAPTD
jgi:hypothetical protein